MGIYSIDYSNKLVKRLNTLQNQILFKERSVSTYRYFSNETPEIPEYDFEKTQALLNRIQKIIITIKHKIREVNMTEKVASGITADEAILELAFLNNGIGKLREMATSTAKTTVGMNGGNGSEIKVCNYDIAVANSEYNKVYNRIMQLQDELNSFNIMHQIKLDVDVEEIFETFTI